jgi:KipI family sensor histidine kinase inhibitor
MSELQVLEVGASALLVETGSAEEALGVYAAVRAAGLAVIDVVPAATTVLLDGVADARAVRAFLDSLDPSALPRHAGEDRVVEVPTTYDGEDLDDVARLWGTTPDEVVAVHTSSVHLVAFCGFAPGFAYCTGLPRDLAVPRLERPRARVPAGSVAVAGGFTGVYPTASPGGWRLLGRTSLPLWDPDADQPATLAPGTRVRFVAVDR